MATCRRKRHDGVDLGRRGIGRGNIGDGPWNQWRKVDVEDELSVLVQSH